MLIAFTDFSIFFFLLQVAIKTNEMHIGKMEAIFEVYTDLLVDRAGGMVDKALLWVLCQDFKEVCVSMHAEIVTVINC